MASRVSSQRSRFHRNRESLEDKHAFDQGDAKFAALEKQYIGQLPGDQDKNLKILVGPNSQLDSHTQTRNRAEPDQSYTQPWPAQQLPVRHAPSQTSTCPQAVRQQSGILRSQLRFHYPPLYTNHYTNHYPDVVKTRNDIAAVQRQLIEAGAAAAAGDTDTSRRTGQIKLAET